MASKQMLMLAVAVAVAFAFLPALDADSHTEHMVGDSKGWTPGFNYTAWAETTQFKVGDSLVFWYNQPSHTVVEVDGDHFKACTWPPNATVMDTGKDQVPLDRAGRRWFICSVGKHCENGMKVKIDVLADNAMAPAAPAPAGNHAPNVQARLAQAVLAVAVVVAVLVL